MRTVPLFLNGEAVLTVRPSYIRYKKWLGGNKKIPDLAAGNVFGWLEFWIVFMDSKSDFECKMSFPNGRRDSGELIFGS